MQRYKLSDYRSIRAHTRELIREVKMLDQPEHIIAHIKFIKEIKRELTDFLISRGYERRKIPTPKSGRKSFRKV